MIWISMRYYQPWINPQPKDILRKTPKKRNRRKQLKASSSSLRKKKQLRKDSKKMIN